MTTRALLLGGTFDPIHLGHLAVARQTRALLDADEVWLIPVNVPPHRGATVAAAADRLAMAEAAAATEVGMRVLDLELRRPGPSYTADTVTALAEAHPGVEQWFLLGADAAREIGTWHGIADLLRVARFVLVNRQGEARVDAADAARLGFDPSRLRIVSVDSPLISATTIRARAAAGEPLTGLVPAGVERIVRERGLYGAPRG